MYFHDHNHNLWMCVRGGGGHNSIFQVGRYNSNLYETRVLPVELRDLNGFNAEKYIRHL